MGDLGSFQLGIILSFFLIEKIFKLNFLSLNYNANFLMNLLIASLVIPLFIYDFIYFFFRRILKKTNPFREMLIIYLIIFLKNLKRKY